jgi:hypothetical protein
MLTTMPICFTIKLYAGRLRQMCSRKKEEKKRLEIVRNILPLPM